MLTTKLTTFDKLLLQAIDETLNSLGTSVGQSIYYHIENKISVDRSEIPQRLGEFQEGLEKIFGTGARFIEMLIMKKLHMRIGHPLTMETQKLEFIEYVNAAKQTYRGKGINHAPKSQPYALSSFPVFKVSVAMP